MRQKIKVNLEERKDPSKRPPSQAKKAADSDDGGYDDGFDAEVPENGDEQLDKLRRALNKEN